MKQDILSITSTSISIRLFSSQISSTIGNIKQVKKVDELILLFRHQTFDSLKLALLHKIFKAARLAMADCIILNCTNTQLLVANIQ